jgi:putative tryptophan/tyrosine transport system substrate-binding protein
MGAWLVGETAGRPFPLPVLGRLSRAQSKMAAPSPFRREPSSIFRRLSEPSHFVPSCRGTAHLVGALRQGLGDEGFVESRNVAIEQRHADNQLDRLPGLAAELVRRQVSVIVGNVVAVDAARAATTTIPIVFVTGEDPVKGGLVASLNRPEANLTGVTFFGGSQLDAKRLELLRDLATSANHFAGI